MTHARCARLALLALAAACGGGDLVPDPDAAPPPMAETGARLVVPFEVPVGRPFPVLVVLDAPADDVLELDGAAAAHPIGVHRWRGATSARVDRAGGVELVARGQRVGGRATVVAVDRPTREVSGALALETWTPDLDVVVTADTTIEQLVIEPGTRVRLAPGADLTITARLDARASEATPILFVPDGDAPWGGLALAPGATGALEWVWLIGGGGDPAQAFGHSGSQPVVLVDGAALTMAGGGVIDAPGKAFGARAAEVALTGTIVTHVDTGGELVDSTLVATGGHWLEIPDADGRLDDDDNDGLYLRGVRRVDGVVAPSHIAYSIFAAGEDDAIDHNGAEVLVEHTLIRGFAHEGLAASTGGVARLRDVVIEGCAQGVEAGYGAPELIVEHALITGCGVGARYGDDYAMAVEGHLTIRDSVVVGNDDDLRNFVVALDGPRPDAITIACSLLTDPDVPPGDGALDGTPRLDGVCVAPGSPGAGAACDGGDVGPLTCPLGPPY